MPKKAARPSIADLDAAPGGAAAVDRALALLAVFREGDDALTLAELAARTGLYKSTILRLLGSLQHAALIRRLADGRYALGDAIPRLHALYAASFTLESQVLPALRELAGATGESAAFQVREGDERRVLFHVAGPDPPPGDLQPGERLPLTRGAAGRVLTAFTEAQGGIYARIRADGVVVIKGERLPELAGIAAPVFRGGEAPAALSLTLPTARLVPALADAVREAAARLTQRLGGHAPPVG